MVVQPASAGWHPDPYERHELRYWDGKAWTEQVSTNGQQTVDAPSGPQPPAPEQIRQQVQKAGITSASDGGGTIFTEPVLVVNQKAKWIEVTNEYAVFDQHGTQIAAVRQVGQSRLRKAVRVLSTWDKFMTQRLEIRDLQGQTLLQLTRPAKVFKSTVIVGNPTGAEIGRIVQQNVFGKIRFLLEAGGQTCGSLNAENWRAWNFTIQDEGGAEVARITKTWEGVAKALFTTADNYVVQIRRPLDDPLRSLVVSAALTVDTALKQTEY